VNEENIVYEIRIRGHLDPGWTRIFAGMTVSRKTGGDTLLSGPVADQAALHAILRSIRDLGIGLLSVNRVVSDTQETSANLVADEEAVNTTKRNRRKL
jgi:hypothetical protein